jgi:hypothetical protein
MAPVKICEQKARDLKLGIADSEVGTTVHIRGRNQRRNSELVRHSDFDLNYAMRGRLWKRCSDGRQKWTFKWNFWHVGFVNG